METRVSLSQIGLYNPQRQSSELTEKLFVVRQKQFESLIENLNEEARDSIPRHHLILAQRGMGKTTMLKRIEVELHKEQYRHKFIPVLFPEEQYGLTDLNKFWLNCLDALADSLDVEKYDEHEINKIDCHIKELMHSKITDDLNEKLYRYLMFICKQLGRRPVLLIDNIGLVFNRLSHQEQHVLRGYISEKRCPIIISAGVAMAGYSDVKEHVVNYSAPFYDFFQIHYLKKMNMEDFIELIQNLSKVTQIDISITSKELPRLKSLIQLTGGNPRTSVMLFKLLVKGFSDEIVDDLEALLDEITPLYKARFEELPTQQQIILDAIAQNWNPMSLKRISEETRFANNQLSPQLKRLVEDGWLETTKAMNAKGNAYSIPERFFCIYHIMRNGSRRSKKQIIYLSKFLECFYGKQHLSKIACSFIDHNFIDERKRILAIAMLETSIKKSDKKRLKDKIVLTVRELKQTDVTFFDKNDYAIDVYKETMFDKLLSSFDKNDYIEAKEITDELNGICSESELLLIKKTTALKFGRFEEAEKLLKQEIDLGSQDIDNWKSYGFVLLKQGKVIEAEESFKNAIALNDADAGLWANLGHTLIAQEKASEAETAFKKSTELNKTDVDNWDNLIRSLLMQKKYTEAEAAIQDCTKSNENDFNAWHSAGDFYLKREKYDESEKSYKKALSLNETNSKLWFLLSNLYEQQKRYDEAENAIQKVAELGKEDTNAWEVAGNFYSKIKKYKEAENAYKKSIDLDENNIQARYEISKLYVDLDCIDEAEKQVEKISELGKSNSSVLSTMGDFYFDVKRDNYDKAEKLYKEAISLNENNPKLWFSLNKLYVRLNRFDEAEQAMQKVIELDKDNSNAWGVAGNFYSEIRKIKEAEAAYKHAIELEEKNLQARFDLSKLYISSKRFDDAEIEIQGLIKLDTDSKNADAIGQLYFKINKYVEAEKFLRQAVSLDSTDDTILLYLCYSLLHQEKAIEAEETMQKFIKLNESNSNAWGNVGDFYSEVKKYDKAENAYKKAIDLDENNIQARYKISKLYVDLDRIDEAEKQVEKISKLGKDDSSILATMGDFYFDVKRDDYEKAEKLYKDAISLNENNPKLWFALNKLYVRLNRLDDAETVMLKITELDKDNSNAWGVAGDFYSEIKKYDKAEDSYKNAIELTPENLQMRHDLSKLYIELNRFDDAEREIQAITKLDTDNRAVGAIGKLYFEMKKYEEAEKFLQQAVNVDNTNDMYWWGLGYSLSVQGKDAEAEEALKQAVKIDKEDPYYWSFLGTSLISQNKYAEAEEAFRQASELDKDNVEFLTNLGISLYYQEKHKKSIEVFKKVIDLDPNNADAYYFLGNAYENIKDYTKAIEYYTESIRLDPNDDIKYNRRGLLHSDLKENSEAISDFSRAIELNPNNANYYNNRGWEYAYGECKDYNKAIADYTKAMELDADCNAKKHLIRLYRDIKNQFAEAKELFNTLDAMNTPKDIYCLEQTLFALQERNEGIANSHLSEALYEMEDGFNPETQGNWEYFAAITIKLGYAQWLLDILSQKGFDIILSPFFVAIQSLEIERVKTVETAEIYLKNQAIEKSEPARMIIEKMKIYL